MVNSLRKISLWESRDLKIVSNDQRFLLEYFFQTNFDRLVNVILFRYFFNSILKCQPRPLLQVSLDIRCLPLKFIPAKLRFDLLQCNVDVFRHRVLFLNELFDKFALLLLLNVLFLLLLDSLNVQLLPFPQLTFLAMPRWFF